MERKADDLRKGSERQERNKAAQAGRERQIRDDIKRTERKILNTNEKTARVAKKDFVKAYDDKIAMLAHMVRRRRRCRLNTSG